MSFPTVRLQAEALSMQFGRRRLFSKLGLVLEGGRSLAVTGPNGSGKSTLLTILAGLRSPSGGSVTLRIGDEDVSAEQRPLRCGFMAPYVQLYDDLSLRENLAFLAEARRMRGADGRIEGLVARVGLDGRGADLLKTYSSGMKQRARLAAALLHEPPLLLLDEPGSNLDDAGRALIADIVAAHTQAGGAVVIATNVAAEAGLASASVPLG